MDDENSGDEGYAQNTPAGDFDQGPAVESYLQQPFQQREPQLSSFVQSKFVPDEAAVTLIFKDGRPSEQIHNYLLTPKSLAVLDQHRREIPLEVIDLVATVRANRDSGVDFSVPGGPDRQRP